LLVVANYRALNINQWLLFLSGQTNNPLKMHYCITMSNSCWSP